MGVPSFLRPKVERVHHGDLFCAVQLSGYGFLSIHLPHSGRPDTDVFDCMNKISALVHSWKSSPPIMTHTIIGGDLNATLPANLPPLSGSHVFAKHVKRKDRLDKILDWVAELGLVALNTFAPEVIHTQQAWTWCNKKGDRSQIDYILASDSLVGRAWVEDAWKSRVTIFPSAQKLRFRFESLECAANFAHYTVGDLLLRRVRLSSNAAAFNLWKGCHCDRLSKQSRPQRFRPRTPRLVAVGKRLVACQPKSQQPGEHGRGRRRPTVARSFELRT